ncbi:MAG: 3-isopropylmalate dehydratase small subunit [Roseiarcus sp.]|jgi:3-isopropylmalate/(R)-2-methylmalate dehydratase small subunit
MQRFTHIAALAMPLAEPNIDTDQIIPARFLRKPRNGGFGQFLFHDRRFRPDGTENPDFALNREPWREARIIVAEENFACGSSRENAVWALHDYGFRVIIAPSFGDIFNNNALKNGLLPVRLPAEVVSSLLPRLAQMSDQTIEVDLASQTVTLRDGSVYPFDLDPFAKHCLLNGIDEIDYTLSLVDEIAAFEQRYGRENG